MNRTAASPEPKISPYGECAVRVAWEAEIRPDIHRRVKALSEALEGRPFPGMVECVPSYAAVTVFYDPFETGNARRRGEFGDERRNGEEPVYRTVCDLLGRMAGSLNLSAEAEPRVVDIPVCYGGEHGPDLEEVAGHAGLTPEKVVEIHAGGDYLVYMIGFAPGFPYLGGMPESIAAPRRQTPRSAIPAGAVGIAGKQTGVYPLSTPGGWQLIGRTPLALFRPAEDPPSLLRAGDRVRFRPIGPEEFLRLEAAHGEGRP
ncbi:5-oxoprolinase subunit PxpB [Saccharibacillus alkalitolerans]|uniref:5-oxoprolinase subunit PxpB n=1 Tax=Saccharibacillus alkalitolerans TaxID=2705290 RepID=A0ABX0FCH5_9BACL|nr:5-oxoprolinase subunit PxpB [Saccharibacillus alkalitolerans]NGZ77219.1 5-oxoprolinase subunit PxpB [Saccharibacillus alkalitolerans]